MLLANAAETPAPTREIGVWDLHSGSVQVIRPSLLRQDHTFLYGTAWLDTVDLAVVACDLTRVRSEDRKGEPWRWNEIISYRAQQTRVLAVGITTGRTRVLTGENGGHFQVEHVSRGEVAVWHYGARRGRPRAVVVAHLNPAGDVLAETRLPARPPEGRWSTGNGAVGTAQGQFPLLVRELDAGEFRLSRFRDGCLEDIYCTERPIGGVFGSPDGEHVAILEREAVVSRIARSDLKVLNVAEGTALTVADDAYGASRIAWSPDGARIAYARDGDGHIAIVDALPEQTIMSAPVLPAATDGRREHAR